MISINGLAELFSCSTFSEKTTSSACGRAIAFFYDFVPENLSLGGYGFKGVHHRDDDNHGNRNGTACPLKVSGDCLQSVKVVFSAGETAYSRLCIPNARDAFSLIHLLRSSRRLRSGILNPQSLRPCCCLYTGCIFWEEKRDIFCIGPIQNILHLFTDLATDRAGTEDKGKQRSLFYVRLRCRAAEYFF